MNDHDLLHQVDALLEQGQPSEDDLLNQLASLQPVSTAAHRDSLEKQLLALAANPNPSKKGLSIMKAKNRPQSVLTRLVAGLMLFLLGGAVALLVLPKQENQPTNNFGSSDLLEVATSTPSMDIFVMTATPIPFQPTYDPFQLTATQVIQQATVMAGGINLQVSPTPTFVFTATPLAIQSVTVPLERFVAFNAATLMSTNNQATEANLFALVALVNADGLTSLENLNLDDVHVENLATPLITRYAPARLMTVTLAPDGVSGSVELFLHPDDLPVLQWFLQTQIPLVLVPVP